MSIQSPLFRRTISALGILTLVIVTGCSSAKKKNENIEPIPTAPSAEETAATGDSDHGGAMGLQTIHFPYDSFTLDAEAKATLKSNAQIMKDHPNLRVQIEGHCDQRGGIQYNIALGEKRANAVRGYMEDMGVSEDKVTVISYGKERPIDPANTDEAYAKNRRANFVITSR